MLVNFSNFIEFLFIGNLVMSLDFFSHSLDFIKLGDIVDNSNLNILTKIKEVNKIFVLPRQIFKKIHNIILIAVLVCAIETF